MRARSCPRTRRGVPGLGRGSAATRPTFRVPSHACAGGSGRSGSPPALSPRLRRIVPASRANLGGGIARAHHVILFPLVHRYDERHVRHSDARLDRHRASSSSMAVGHPARAARRGAGRAHRSRSVRGTTMCRRGRGCRRVAHGAEGETGSSRIRSSPPCARHGHARATTGWSWSGDHRGNWYNPGDESVDHAIWSAPVEMISDTGILAIVQPVQCYTEEAGRRVPQRRGWNATLADRACDRLGPQADLRSRDPRGRACGIPVRVTRGGRHAPFHLVGAVARGISRIRRSANGRRSSTRVVYRDRADQAGFGQWELRRPRRRTRSARPASSG